MSREERFWRILLREVKAASRRTRWMLVGVLSSGAVAIGIQVVAEALTGDGPLSLPELLAVVAGSLGAVLVAFAHVLHNSAQKIQGCKSDVRGIEPRIFHQVLLTLPAIGLMAGVLLGAAIGLLIVQAIRSTLVLALAALVYGWIVFLAAKMVHNTTRFLFRHAREQAEQAAEARNQATEAQLSALQARMNPHFLFNALNTVATLVRESPESAERTVENLAGVLRRTLDRSKDPLRTVGDEVDYLRAYLAVEQERWGERLDIVWEIDPATRELPLPPMTLQPLVENALQHGLGTRIEGGRLVIGAERLEGSLVLSVSDDGIGYPTRAPERTGLGNLRQRLETLYGDEAKLEVRRTDPGTRVTVELPVSGPAWAAETALPGTDLE